MRLYTKNVEGANHEHWADENDAQHIQELEANGWAWQQDQALTPGTVAGQVQQPPRDAQGMPMTAGAVQSFVPHVQPQSVGMEGGAAVAAGSIEVCFTLWGQKCYTYFDNPVHALEWLAAHQGQTDFQLVSVNASAHLG